MIAYSIDIQCIYDNFGAGSNAGNAVNRWPVQTVTDTTTSIVFNTTPHTRVKGRSVGKRVTHCRGESKTSRNEFLAKNTLSWLFYSCIFNTGSFLSLFLIKEFRIIEYRVYWDSFIQVWVSARTQSIQPALNSPAQTRDRGLPFF